MPASPARNDGLLVSVDLLIEYGRVSAEAYERAGVKSAKLEPFHRWLPKAINGEIEEAAAVQAVRDAKLAELLFMPKHGVRELPAMDVAGLFADQGHVLAVYGRETPDALDALLARLGLPQSIPRFALVSQDMLATLVSDVLRDSELACDWWLVYDPSLSTKNAREVLDVLQDRGVLVNGRNAEDAVLELVSSRWTR